MKENVNKANKPHDDEGKNALLCSLPLVPDRQIDDNINPYVESLIRYIEKKWVNHTLLHYHFLEANCLTLNVTLAISEIYR